MENQKKPTVGFIGQGWVGKTYADMFAERGFNIVRYGLEEPYRQNKDDIPDCDIVFIAVPTPTTEEEFDDSIVREAVGLVGVGKTAVIKSTILPGTTESIQKEYPNKFVFHAPEFLTEANAKADVRNPSRNIIGRPKDNSEYNNRAQTVIDILPDAPTEMICDSKEAELVKYAGNTFLYMKVMFANLFYDLAETEDIDWATVRQGMVADERIGETHLEPIHHSQPGKKPARGAGGDCFIKDFSAIKQLFAETLDDEKAQNIFAALEDKNIELLCDTNKDTDILKEVYGDNVCR
jgi:UDPglucose 6-dehydrogenase